MSDLPHYEEPEWAGIPAHEFSFDVIKGGVVLPNLSLTKAGKSYVTMGRLASCDFVVEHPSLSRLHAVVQFSKNADELFVFDNASSNGTFLNKAKIAPKEYVRLKVGDQLRFGQSTRVYILMGPEHLMAEEGLNRKERAQLKYLEELEKQRSKSKGALEMGTALQAHNDEGFATWGIQEDIEDDYDARGAEIITWQSYDGKMNEKQEKQLLKLKTKLGKIDRIRIENQKIQVKEKTQGDLTDGQRDTLLRNAKRLETLEEEVELMEDSLNESLRTSFTARQENLAEPSAKTGKKKRPRNEDIENDGSDDDDFFDRTQSFKKKREQRKSNLKTGGRKVETIDGLWNKREDLRKSVKSCTELIKEQEAKVNVCKAEKDEADALESYMSNLASDDEHTRLLKLQTELKQLAAELASVESMYKMSDPDGLYDESKRKDIKRREKQKEREKILLESREKTAELPADVGNSNDPYSSVRDPSLGDQGKPTNEAHTKDAIGGLTPKAKSIISAEDQDKLDMPPPPPRVIHRPLPMPRNQDIGKATPNDRQDASDDNHSEASRAGDTAGQEDDQDFSPRFPLNQGELPPALPDDMITRKDDDNFLDRKSLLKAGLEIRQKPSKTSSSETKIDSDAYARRLVDQILSAKEGISSTGDALEDADDTNEEYLTGTLKEWLPPQGQDGSGYRDINKKMGY